MSATSTSPTTQTKKEASMNNVKRRSATITSFPHPVTHPRLNGLRLQEGATIALVVEAFSEEEMTVGIHFKRNGKERTVFSDDRTHVCWLPALSSPSCGVTIELDGENVNLYVYNDPLEINTIAALAGLAEFLEELDDSEPDEERFAGSAEQ
jgi:hypothetical protein